SVSSGGSASVSYGLPAYTLAGSYTIDASYTDSSRDFTDSSNATQSPTPTLTISAASATTTASNTTATFSTSKQDVTLKASVSSSAGAVNEGKVKFTVVNGTGAIIGTAASGSVSSNGSASVNYGLPAYTLAGSYTIAVSYSDSLGTFTDGGDNNATLTITPAQVITTPASTAVVYDTSSQAVTLNATVADTSIPSNTVGEGTVTFTVKNGSTVIGAPVQGTVSDGQASASFILPAGQAIGGYTIIVGYNDSRGSFIDSGDNNAALTVQLAPIVTTNPSNQPILVGGSATFTAAADGNPMPTVQWQVSTDGGITFSNISGATNTTLTLTNVQTFQNGYQYRAVFSNGIGTAASSAAMLSVLVPPTVMTNPASQTATAGGTVTFTAAAGGMPTPTVQWQVSTDNGATFSDISGATNTTLTLNNVQTSQNGDAYRAVFTSSAGTVDSSTATLTVQAPIVAATSSSSPVLQMPPLVALINGILGGIEMVNANGTMTVTYGMYGITLLMVTYDSSGNFLSATLLGFDISNLVWRV
ncbi:MAG TPA: immunoglobulin domain-containing protein, partial [Gemmataceae bacterium]|nr:immunoglobulin domain-containing protein [Gemmataceae bacterium]